MLHEALCKSTFSFNLLILHEFETTKSSINLVYLIIPSVIFSKLFYIPLKFFKKEKDIKAFIELNFFVRIKNWRHTFILLKLFIKILFILTVFEVYFTKC